MIVISVFPIKIRWTLTELQDPVKRATCPHTQDVNKQRLLFLRKRQIRASGSIEVLIQRLHVLIAVTPAFSDDIFTK